VQAHGVRFALTSLGILWGTLMLTFLSATLEGSEQHYVREMEEIGPRLVFVFPGTLIADRVGERGARKVELDDEDPPRLARLGTIEASDPNIALWNAVARADGRTRLLNVFGVTPAAERIRAHRVAEGRFISATDLASNARVAFLGADARERLFGRGPALGRTLQIDSVRFRVIGIAAPKGEQLVNVQGRDDRSILIPAGAAARWFRRTDAIEVIAYAPRSVEASFASTDQARQLLALHHRFDPKQETALAFFNLQDALQILRTLFSGMRLFNLFAGLATLLVGAIGVLNVMLVVVHERTAEIGLRKALGATDRAIFVQFLLEALVVSLGSGVVGAGLGLAVVRLVAVAAPAGSPLLSAPLLEPATAVVVVAALTLTGVTAAVVPARRAARTPPAESLRGL
jgi:putative ABC transport system permease protein